MKERVNLKYCITGFFSILSLWFSAFSVAQRINDFALLDQEGKFHQLSYYQDSKIVSFLVLPKKNQQPLLQSYQQLATEIKSTDVIFTILNPADVDDRHKFQLELRRQGVTLPVLIDDTGLVGELLKVSHFGEVVLVDPSRNSVLYSGPVGRPLRNAISEILNNTAVSTPKVTLADLPIIQREEKFNNKPISFSKDVAPILIKHCLACHRDNGVAPFAMDSWGVVLGWSPMIKEVLMSKRMPPGQIDPTIGHFSNSRVLSAEEIRKVIHWIDSGGVNDSDDDPLEKFIWPTVEWAFGEPDLVIELPEQTVPAAGLVDYADIVLPIPLSEDVWLRASQFIPGDRRVLHHAEALVLPTRSNQGLDSESPHTAKEIISKNYLRNFSNRDNPNIALIPPYVPGAEPEVQPRNTGGMIRRDSYLALQLHYAAIGREIADKTRLGLWFYDKDKQPDDRLVVACTCLDESQWQVIPAREGNFIAKAELLIEKNIYLYSVFPQLHYRGKAIRFDAHLPNGDIEPLLNVPKYNFNWQIDYQLVRPKFLPAGTKIVATATYDNSNKNAFNPDASQDVPWGRESFNEILAGVFHWKEVE